MRGLAHVTLTLGLNRTVVIVVLEPLGDACMCRYPVLASFCGHKSPPGQAIQARLQSLRLQSCYLVSQRSLAMLWSKAQSGCIFHSKPVVFHPIHPIAACVPSALTYTASLADVPVAGGKKWACTVASLLMLTRHSCHAAGLWRPARVCCWNRQTHRQARQRVQG